MQFNKPSDLGKEKHNEISKKLENNLLDMIQEQQVKIGYMSGVTRFYYPLQSLNRLLGTELTEEEMQHANGKILRSCL